MEPQLQPSDEGWYYRTFTPQTHIAQEIAEIEHYAAHCREVYALDQISWDVYQLAQDRAGVLVPILRAALAQLNEET